ncbi:hypothetical protein [Agrilutibacter solisilvae]|uniref:Uncharacterized protein n=1 Tax=Agrilutibacter solisilvae TaxID=2763317 RepID=A0A974Y183_9GAMM|nr:hypothetical protein [Lysobacter solisilvae]QSX78678.1 hypothetical protein I8J32_001680 [Lysobacter solisilvae]
MQADALNRRNLMPWMFLAVLAGALIPVVMALFLARGQARHRQEQRALSYAADVLRRSEDTGDQILHAFTALEREGWRPVAARWSGSACSAAM